MSRGTTNHDLALSELLRQRNVLINDTDRGSMRALSEEGHVFDHEPGMPDYHHDHPQFELHEDLEDSEAHYYADHEARYPVFLEHNFGSYEDYQPNDTESNLYHSWTQYTPVVAHDWEQKKRQPKPRVYDEFEEYQGHEYTNEVDTEDSASKLDFVAGLRRMSFEGLKEKDRVDEKQKLVKAAAQSDICSCRHGLEPCCEYETRQREDLHEYFEVPTTGHAFHRAHYCMTGDEPECDHLRKEEHHTAE